MLFEDQHFGKTRHRVLLIEAIHISLIRDGTNITIFHGELDYYGRRQLRIGSTS